MPERDHETGHSSRLLRGLIWAGVLLAPLAAAIVLLGQSSNSVRFAVLLIAVSVVLVGASVLIRADPVLQRMHVEDRIAEEIEALRADLRAELASAAVPQGFVPAPGGPGMAPAPGGPGMAPAPGGPGMAPVPGAPGRASVPSGPGRASVSAGPGLAAVPAGPGVASVPGGPVAASVPGGPGRASVPGGPGMASVPGGPGLASVPGVPVAATASAAIPVQRGASSVPPPSAPPRAVAAVRPGNEYGRAEPHDDDFGAGSGYADLPPAAPGRGTYGSARVNGFDGDYGYDDQGHEDYGHGNGDYGHDDFGHDDFGQAEHGRGEYGPGEHGRNDYGSGDYGQGRTYGYASGVAAGYDPDGDYGAEGDSGNVYGGGGNGYGLAGGYDGPSPGGDAGYKARRHRPSANDTNVGTFEDFASYPGWDAAPAGDDRYAQGYGRRR
ncbi:hypothetical protein ACQP2F_44495 [Actinoplanes sp. CA-030573]|uniref:hypothetical protein n=1 Tax=Actinoplanes sp. CA-030573 TaxID=3239898 RepID=UPI003D89E999